MWTKARNRTGSDGGRRKYETLAEQDRARYDVAKREYQMTKKDQNVRFCQMLIESESFSHLYLSCHL